MESIRQVATVPANRELLITLPSHIPENEEVEIILLFGRRTSNFQLKVESMKEAMNDPLFLEDLREVAEDFANLDSEDWEAHE